VIVTVLSIYLAVIICVANLNAEGFSSIIPIVVLAWVGKVLATIIFIRKNKIIEGYH
jgi:hypothetical protein